MRQQVDVPALTPRLSESEVRSSAPAGSANALETSSVPCESIPRSCPTAGEKDAVGLGPVAGGGRTEWESRACLMIFIKACERGRVVSHNGRLRELRLLSRGRQPWFNEAGELVSAD